MKLSAREIKVVAAGAGVVLLIIAWSVAGALSAKKADLIEAYELKQDLVKRYARQVAAERTLMDRQEALEKEISALEAGLLSAATPVLATAGLQSMVEGVLKPRGVEIRNIKVLKAKESGPFKAVGVEVTFYSSTSELVEMLYDIENHAGAIYIDHISMRLQGGGLSPSLRVVMGVGAGYRPGSSDDGLKAAGRPVL